MYTKAAVLIKKGEKYLLVQENHSFQNKDWNWPQGKVEDSETSEEAAAREGREETGLELKIERRLGILLQTFPDTEKLHVFLASPISETVSIPLDEIKSFKWVSRDEIERMRDMLVGDWIIEMVNLV